MKFKLRSDSLSKKERFLYILWEMGCTAFLIAWYGYFIYVFATNFLATHNISALLYVIYELIIVFFLLIRNIPKEVSFAPYDWFVALGGTLGPTLMRPAEVSMLPDMDFLIVLQILGMIISGLGLLSLSNSFGAVAANRGIKTDGLYKYIRHPLYSGYFMTLVAFLLQNANLYNFAIVAMVFTFKLLRIFAEERFLLEDPEYAAYAEKTKWRVIPYVW